MEGFWPIFFLLVVLKIPVFFALWLIWWAGKAPETDGAAEDSGDGFNRWRPQPRPRGPHPLPGGSGAGATGRRRAAPPGQRRPLFRPPARQVPSTQRAKNRATGTGAQPPPIKPPA